MSHSIWGTDPLRAPTCHIINTLSWPSLYGRVPAAPAILSGSLYDYDDYCDDIPEYFDYDKPDEFDDYPDVHRFVVLDKYGLCWGFQDRMTVGHVVCPGVMSYGTAWYWRQ